MNEEAFHRVLLDDPRDELTWSALADWLEDDGQPLRAELLRLTRRLRTLPLDARGDVAARVESLLASSRWSCSGSTRSACASRWCRLGVS